MSRSSGLGGGTGPFATIKPSASFSYPLLRLQSTACFCVLTLLLLDVPTTAGPVACGTVVFSAFFASPFTPLSRS